MRALLWADAALFTWVASWPHVPLVDQAVLAISAAGQGGRVWLLLAFGIAIARRGRAAMAAWRVALAIGLSAIVADATLKPLAARERPFVAMHAVRVTGEAPASASFPSGHAALAVAGAFSLSLAWPERRRVWWLLALLVIVSRVYLGVHYPADVLGGALVGWACARFATARTPCYTAASAAHAA